MPVAYSETSLEAVRKKIRFRWSCYEVPPSRSSMALMVLGLRSFRRLYITLVAERLF